MVPTSDFFMADLSSFTVDTLTAFPVSAFAGTVPIISTAASTRAKAQRLKHIDLKLFLFIFISSCNSFSKTNYLYCIMLNPCSQINDFFPNTEIY